MAGGVEVVDGLAALAEEHVHALLVQAVGDVLGEARAEGHHAGGRSQDRLRRRRSRQDEVADELFQIGELAGLARPDRRPTPGSCANHDQTFDDAEFGSGDAPLANGAAQHGLGLGKLAGGGEGPGQRARRLGRSRL